MSVYHGIRKTVEFASFDLAGATELEYIPGQPVDIQRLGFVLTTSKDGTAAVLTVSKRPTAGSASGAVAIGTFSVPANKAAGTAVYVEFGKPATAAETGEDGSVRYTGDPDILKLDVGESLHVVSDGGGAAGAAIPFVEVYEQPFAGSRVADASEAVFTYS